MVLHEPDMFDIYSRSQRGGPVMANDLMMPRDIMRKPVMPQKPPMNPWMTKAQPMASGGITPGNPLPPTSPMAPAAPPALPNLGMPGMGQPQRKNQFGILDGIMDQPNRRQPFRM